MELNFDEPTTVAHVQTLALAFRSPGALQVLEVLRPHPTTAWRAGMLPLLANALASDATPALQTLDLKCGPSQDADLEALAAMLETRAQRLACRGLDVLKTGTDWVGKEVSEASRCRLMRALLHTVTELENFTWDAAYAACFLAAQPPRLTKCAVLLHTFAPSVGVWESMPALEHLVYGLRRLLDCVWRS